MATKFKSGDLVALKSGGPVMTAEKASASDDGCWCVWFAGAKRERAYFEFEALEAAQKPAPPPAKK